MANAGYLDENPEEVFSGVYERLGALPLRAARDPYVWLRLEELKREPCDQKSVGNLALMLDKLGYRREAANGLYNFVRLCGAPLTALHQSINTYLKLTDYAKAVEVADEFGKLEAVNVPIAVQSVDDRSYGAGIDGLLGMSFLSRFEVQMAAGFVEVRIRRPKK